MMSTVVTLRVADATRIDVDGGAVSSLAHGYITRDVVRSVVVWLPAYWSAGVALSIWPITFGAGSPRTDRYQSCFRPPSIERDSSVLLGAAVAIARREGLPLPVTVTLTYPRVPETDETAWQHQVLDHLGVQDRAEIVHDEQDILGPIATLLLQRHGSLWPPNLALTWRLMDQARRGVLIIGEGGDEVFGVSGSRRCVVFGAGPMRRRAMLRSPYWYQRTWLRTRVRALLERRDVEDEAALALHAGRSTLQYTQRRAVCRSFETHRALGRDIDVEYVAPIADTELVAAVAHAAGFWGWHGRTAPMTHLFGDLLPRAVLQRASKATFGRAVFTDHGRDFAAQWNGDGMDHDLVHPELLRDIWLSDQPDGGTMVLMQKAWLASQPVSQDTT